MLGLDYFERGVMVIVDVHVYIDSANSRSVPESPSPR